MTTIPGALASAYTDAKLTTASPQKLLVLLYDRLVLDLDRAEESLAAGRSAHADLVHAQDIVMELLSSLDTEMWTGGQALASIYTYLHTQLVTANVRRDAAIVAEVRSHVVPLRDAWRQAAGMGPTAAAGTPGSSTAPVASGTVSAYAAGAATVALADVRAARPAPTTRAPLSVTA
ncbi:MAG: flagellar export chaperone FliS [Candidatus Nanopelagicales bacterium]|jgi:flagellar protein FliS